MSTALHEENLMTKLMTKVAHVENLERTRLFLYIPDFRPQFDSLLCIKMQARHCLPWDSASEQYQRTRKPRM